MTDTVTLRTGAVVPAVMISVVRISLEELMRTEPISFYELVCLCRDPGHTLFGDTLDLLKGRSLVEATGQPHDVIKQIVLASIEDDGLDLRLRQRNTILK